MLRQVGAFHESDTTLGRIVTALIHPVTMARVVARMTRARRKG